MIPKWHYLSIKQVAKILDTDVKKGLEEGQVKKRQKKFGLNKLPKEKPLPKLKIFLEQFKSPLIYILAIAGIITLILKEHSDAIVIFGAVFLNTIIGFFQENKASETLKALKKVVRHEAKALRKRNLKIVNSWELVPGDIIVLNAGDKTPADARIIECHGLKVNEMALTGEWLEAKKTTDVLPQKTPLADRDNMIYMGTIVENGKGKAIVTETGINTEIGKVALMLKKIKEEKTPLQKKIDGFAKIITVIISLFCILIFVEGILTGNSFLEMFETSIAVAVAAIPEGLPVSLTVILALGMKRILEKKGLARKLLAVETLGSASIICTDKTATLTEGKMKVDDVVGNKFLSLKTAVSTSGAFIENPDEPKEKWIIRGRPTDRALLEAGIGAGIDKKREFEKRKIAELPFNPINKFAAALYKENGKNILYVCGAPEKILELSKLNERQKRKWQEKLEELAQRGLRVVATGHKRLANLHEDTKNNINSISEICGKLAIIRKKDIRDLTFTGFITLKDPIRPEVKEAIKICHRAGIKPIIVTGDHKLTARAVAQELGFKTKEKNILEGKDLDELSDKEFDKILDKIEIYARVEPKHKLRIVEAWQDKGEVVAMTGDGINDAPALKKADIGVALGSGTEVAQEASDLILLTDSFNVIVKAIEEGRAILDNIRKVITYLLSDSFSEVILIGASLMMGLPLPITPVQILWVNLIEDGLPDIALAFEPKEKDLMQQKPQGHAIPLLTKEMKALIFIIGLITDILLLGLFFWLIRFSGYEISHIRSIIFAGLAIDSLFYVFSCKSLRQNLWRINLFSNKFLVISCVIGIIALIAALYFYPFQILLKTQPLNLFDWQLLLVLGLLNIILIEAAKWYFIVRKDVF